MTVTRLETRRIILLVFSTKRVFSRASKAQQAFARWRRRPRRLSAAYQEYHITYVKRESDQDASRRRSIK